jgi:hypothetical protein
LFTPQLADKVPALDFSTHQKLASSSGMSNRNLDMVHPVITNVTMNDIDELASRIPSADIAMCRTAPAIQTPRFWSFSTEYARSGHASQYCRLQRCEIAPIKIPFQNQQ